MLTVTITNQMLESRLRERAASRGRSPEEEANEILGAAMPAGDISGDQNLGQAIHEAFAKLGGVELDLDWLRKMPDRKLPAFD